MSNSSPEQNPDSKKRPVSDAAFSIAETIHNDLIRELHRGAEPTSFEGLLQVQREQYPALLFGELAMRLAEIELPQDATPADRARGVVAALQRIASTPSLFEAITKAPYDKRTAQTIGKELGTATEPDSKEAAAATKLRSRIAEQGYLERSMVPDKRTVELCYSGIAKAKKRLIGPNLPAKPQEIALKLVAGDHMVWNVQRYGRWSYEEGYTEYKDTKIVRLKDNFNVIALDTSGIEADQAHELDKLVGKYVQIGRVSTGTLLRLDYNFMRLTKEVPSHEPKIQFETLTMPLKLHQAYLGTSRDFPLF